MSGESRANTEVNEDDVIEYIRSGRLLRDVRSILDYYIVGEDNTKILLYLLLLSGQSVIIKGDSSTGKNTLVDGVLSLFPKQDVLEITSSTPRALRYLGTDFIRILYLRETPYEHLSSSGTPFALDLKAAIQDHILRAIYVDTSTGTPRTLVREVKIYSVVQTTTEYELPEDIENRCWVLSTDASPEQTKRVVLAKARRREQMIDPPDAETVYTVQCATKWLLDNKPNIRVRIPVAQRVAAKLADLFPYPRLRRDIDKIFDLVEVIALAHGRTEATLDDVKFALRLAAPVFPYMVKRIDPRIREAFDKFKFIEKQQTFVTAADLARALGCSQTEARRKLRAMLDIGLIIEAGRGQRGVILYKSAETSELKWIDEI